MTQSEARPGRDWRPNAFWIAVAAAFIFFSLGSNLLELRYSYLHAPAAGDWGFTFTSMGPGDVTVNSVDPRSKAAALGLRPGDRLNSDTVAMLFRKFPIAGELVHFTRISPGPVTRIQFIAPRAVAPPMAVPNLLDRVFDDIARISLSLTGLFILWRGSSRRSGFLLALALLSISPFPGAWLPFGPEASFVWGLGFLGLIQFEWLLLPVFAMAFLAESGVGIPAWARLLFWPAVAAKLVSFVAVAFFPLSLFPDWAFEVGSYLSMPLSVVLFALTMTLLAVGWSHGRAESRHRFALLLLAVGLIYLSSMLYVVYNSESGSFPRALTNSATVLRLVGAFLFAYAVLRHKVIDVGFTLNRTLVFGGVSAILLAAFGLAEWGLHQILALEGWEGSALLSAALAVGIFLGFHPVRNFVEHYVSTFFFRPWRNKEQRLRRFVHEAGFFTDGARVAEAFAAALQQFSGGPSSVYRRTEEGSFACATGTMAPVDADDPTAVALRAEGKVCEVEGTNSAVQGMLAFPMIHCHNLEGFAVAGPKANGGTLPSGRNRVARMGDETSRAGSLCPERRTASSRTRRTRP